jgi:enoyl-CoA hydratase
MFVTAQTRSHSLTLTIRRPERLNALGTAIARELNEALDKLVAQFRQAGSPPPCRMVVLAAEEIQRAKGAIWIAGGDLKELAGLSQPAEGRAYAESFSRACQKLESLPVPTVAMVTGDAIGGGAELALSCDLRFATENASFVFKQLEIGLPTGYGATRRLIELVGKSKAQEIILLSRTLSAKQARKKGLVHETFDDETKLLERLEELDTRFGNLSFEAIAAQKAMLRAAFQDRTEAFDHELDLFASAWMNETHRSNLSKFKP